MASRLFQTLPGFLLFSAVAMTGCGSDKPKFSDNRTRNPGNADVAPAQVPGPATSSDLPPLPAPTTAPLEATGDAESTEDPLVTDEQVTLRLFDDAAKSTALRSPYYQSSPALKDLFVNPEDSATSMLCWPATVAFQAEFLRTRATAPLRKLPDPSDQALALDQAAAVDVRHFSTLCKTDLKAGTTVPQGVKCIDEYLKSSGYSPSIEVVGLDAQWGIFGMYPTGTKPSRRAVSFDDVRTAIKAGRSVIALVGFYLSDEANKKYQRVKGHFVSITGFAHKKEWADAEMQLDVVNPGTDYFAVEGARASEKLKVSRFAAQVGFVIPDNVAYQLGGPGFDVAPYVSLLESLIIFDGTAL